jgi:uncharacterized protein YkwD
MRIIISAMLSAFLFLSVASASEKATHISEPSYYIRELLSQINRYRLSHGLKTLSYNKKLAGLAQGHSADLHRRGELNHNGFDQRFKMSGRTLCIENVGWNYKTANEQFLSWKRSEGHNKNMLARDIQRVGIAKIGTSVTLFACN